MTQEVQTLTIGLSELENVIKVTERTILSIREKANKAQGEIKDYEEELEYLQSIISFQNRINDRANIYATTKKKNQILHPFSELSRAQTLLNEQSLICALNRIQYIKKQISLIHEHLSDYESLTVALQTDVKLLREIASHTIVHHNELLVPEKSSLWTFSLKNSLPRSI